MSTFTNFLTLSSTASMSLSLAIFASKPRSVNKSHTFAGKELMMAILSGDAVNVEKSQIKIN